MPVLNKEAKNKTSILKMQLTTEQRVFAVKTYYKTSSYLEVKKTFRRKFSEKDPPTNRAIWENTEGKKKVETSIREDPDTGEPLVPKKQSKLLDSM